MDSGVYKRNVDFVDDTNLPPFLSRFSSSTSPIRLLLSTFIMSSLGTSLGFRYLARPVDHIFLQADAMGGNPMVYHPYQVKLFLQFDKAVRNGRVLDLPSGYREFARSFNAEPGLLCRFSTYDPITSSWTTNGPPVPSHILSTELRNDPTKNASLSNIGTADRRGRVDESRVEKIQTILWEKIGKEETVTRQKGRGRGRFGRGGRRSLGSASPYSHRERPYRGNQNYSQPFVLASPFPSSSSTPQIGSPSSSSVPDAVEFSRLLQMPNIPAGFIPARELPRFNRIDNSHVGRPPSEPLSPADFAMDTVEPANSGDTLLPPIETITTNADEPTDTEVNDAPDVDTEGNDELTNDNTDVDDTTIAAD